MSPALFAQNFGQHGRELITNEVALKLLQLLAHDDQLNEFCAAQVPFEFLVLFSGALSHCPFG